MDTSIDPVDPPIGIKLLHSFGRDLEQLPDIQTAKNDWQEVFSGKAFDWTFEIQQPGEILGINQVWRNEYQTQVKNATGKTTIDESMAELAETIPEGWTGMKYSFRTQFEDLPTATVTSDLGTRGGVKSTVHGFTEYPAIREEIKSYIRSIRGYYAKTELANVNDATFGQWAMAVLKGRTPGYAAKDSSMEDGDIERLDKFFAKLVWLMFGTEGERSPSAYANAMMVLKLIAVGRMTWKEAFDGRPHGGGLFNMSMGGAVEVARTAEIATGLGTGQFHYQGPVSKPEDIKDKLGEFFERQERVAKKYVDYKIERNPKKHWTPKPLDVVWGRMQKLYTYKK